MQTYLLFSAALHHGVLSKYIYQPVKIAGELLVIGIAFILSLILGVVRVAAQSVIYFTDKLQCWVNLMVLCLVDS